MANDKDQQEDPIKSATRAIMLILFIISSGALLGYNMTGTTLVDTWIWFTLAACCEFILGKPLASVISGIKNRITKPKGVKDV